MNYKYSHHITFYPRVHKAFYETPVIPGTLPGMVEAIVRTTIITDRHPLQIDLSIEPDPEGYIILQHQLNERLVKDHSFKQVFDDIQKSYTYFSEKPVVQVKAYEMNYIKIPVLVPEETHLNESTDYRR